MKQIIKIAAAIMLIVVFNAPLLHQTFPDTKVYFSIADAIVSDLEEHQFNTPYFIYTSIKDLF